MWPCAQCAQDMCETGPGWWYLPSKIEISQISDLRDQFPVKMSLPGLAWLELRTGVEDYKTMGDNPLCWVTQPGYVLLGKIIIHFYETAQGSELK